MSPWQQDRAWPSVRADWCASSRRAFRPRAVRTDDGGRREIGVSFLSDRCGRTFRQNKDYQPLEACLLNGSCRARPDDRTSRTGQSPACRLQPEMSTLSDPHWQNSDAATAEQNTGRANKRQTLRRPVTPETSPSPNVVPVHRHSHSHCASICASQPRWTVQLIKGKASA